MLTKTANVRTMAPNRAILKKIPPMFGLRKPDLLSIQDLTPAEVEGILDLTAAVKANPREFARALDGKQVVLMFEKPSLRTRLTFEVGIRSLGGSSLFVDQRGSRIGEREKLSDVAHNLERWMDGIVLRTFEHSTVTEMAKNASIPVVNGLSDLEHPCQALADYFTMKEKFGSLKKIKLAYVGDGNNVAHSLLLTAAMLGSQIAVATPAGYEPNHDIVLQACEIASCTGAQIDITTDVAEAVKGANVIYTDVWASMGQEGEANQRKQIFHPYQVNSKLMSLAASDAFFMHCLPAHRGDEVTDEVIDSPASIVFDEAENRLHVQKSILLLLMGNPSLNWSANA
ncbi:MAG TPA: ornithine carbamoyltransferase [Terriglobales bacterium]|nr:ornithine carbamoyltransferase [Terriglobales bacterium]